jgi:hypothetical protein
MDNLDSLAGVEAIDYESMMEPIENGDVSALNMICEKHERIMADKERKNETFTEHKQTCAGLHNCCCRMAVTYAYENWRN